MTPTANDFPKDPLLGVMTHYFGEKRSLLGSRPTQWGTSSSTSSRLAAEESTTPTRRPPVGVATHQLGNALCYRFFLGRPGATESCRSAACGRTWPAPSSATPPPPSRVPTGSRTACTATLCAGSSKAVVSLPSLIHPITESSISNRFPNGNNLKEHEGLQTSLRLWWGLGRPNPPAFFLVV